MSTPHDPTPADRVAMGFAVAIVACALLLAVWGLVDQLVAQWVAA